MAWYDYIPGSSIFKDDQVAGQPELQRSLEAAAYGRVPSAAEGLLKQGVERGIAGQYALSRSTPGLAPALAARSAQIGAANLTAQAGSQAAILRAQEMAQARAQLAQYLTQQRQMGLERRGQNINLLGAGLSGIGSIGGMLSDERQKTNVASGEDEAEQLLNALQAYQYRYKDPQAPGAAPGPQLGVMAQDVEQAPVGDEMVGDTPGGKMIDPVSAIGPILAALANLHHRMRGLEGR